MDLKWRSLITTEYWSPSGSSTHLFPSPHCLAAPNPNQPKPSKLLVPHLLISTSPRLFPYSCLFFSATQCQKRLVIQTAEQRAALFPDLIPTNVLAHAFMEAEGIIQGRTRKISSKIYSSVITLKL